MQTYIEYLNILELSEGASIKDIKKSYRELVQIWHPDKCGNNENLKIRANKKLKLINEAYEYLIINYKDHFYSEDNLNETNEQKFDIEHTDNFYADMIINFPYSKRKNYNWIKFCVSAFITMILTILIKF